jgi:hypothetical protein
MSVRPVEAQPIGRIQTADVEDLLTDWRARGYLPNTIAGMYSSVRAVFSWAEGRAIPKRSSPCWDVRKVPKWQKVEHPVLRPDDADPDDYIGVRSISNDELIALAEALGPDSNWRCGWGSASACATRRRSG